MAKNLASGSQNDKTARARGYACYVVIILFLVQVLNYSDRMIIGVLVEPIKHDLALSDTQIGLLTGFAFAGVFAVASLPLGWWADRANRRNILALSLLVWSAMTAVSAIATSLPAFFAMRMGVALGEAGGAATTYPLTADYVSARRRAFAFGLIASGTTVGTIVGLVLGGYVAHIYGWRGAFLIAGIPGLPLAALIFLTVKEPVRGFSDAVRFAPSSERIGATLGVLLRRASLLHVMIGASVGSMTNAVLIWLPAFYSRQFGIDSAEIGLRLGAFQGLGALIGTVGGGWLCDRLARRDIKWQPRFAGWTTLLSAPAFAGCFLSTDSTWSMAWLVPAFAMKFACFGPFYSMIQSLAGPSRRSIVTSISMLLLMLGSAFGPLLVGSLSDHMSAADQPNALGLAMCALLPFAVWSALHFFRAARVFQGDLREAIDSDTDPLGRDAQPQG